MALVAFSFGAFGDVLALADLVARVAKSLMESSGASHAYQSLIVELNTLNDALQHVGRLADAGGSRSRSARAPFSNDNLRGFVSACTISVGRIETKIVEYQKKLQKGSSGNRWIESWRKIGWGLFREDEVNKYREEIRGYMTMVHTILAASNHSILGRLQEVTIGQRTLGGDRIPPYSHGRLSNQYDRDTDTSGREKLAKGLTSEDGIVAWSTDRKRPAGFWLSPDNPDESTSGSSALWRTVAERTPRRSPNEQHVIHAPKPTMPEMQSVPVMGQDHRSWATWQADPGYAPTPPSREPTGFVPEHPSPGLFGPRSPRTSLDGTHGPPSGHRSRRIPLPRSHRAGGYSSGHRSPVWSPHH